MTKETAQIGKIYRQGRETKPRRYVHIVAVKGEETVTIKAVQRVDQSSICRPYKGAQTSHMSLRNFLKYFHLTEFSMDKEKSR